jgi:oligopeptide/dipeptide ABC transporter ATP-binding protein
MATSGSAMPKTTGSPLLNVSDLTVEFQGQGRRSPLRAVDGVSLTVSARETVGVVGESGSGKTTIGRAILGLTPVTAGAIAFAGNDITRAGHRERRDLSANLQVVFQDPYSSLNSSRTVGQTLSETLGVHAGQLSRTERAERVASSLERVGLPGAAAGRYPAHFSGGQRQRIAIARALMVQPALVVCDEPVSALDLSVQAQVLNLLHELQTEFGLSYLFIAHDLAVVRHLSHRIIVLYRGRIMEEGGADVVYDKPAHPYTRSLLEAAPVPDPQVQSGRRLARRNRSREQPGLPFLGGCPFVSRCPYAIETCQTVRPTREMTPDGSTVECHRWMELGEPPA